MPQLRKKLRTDARYQAFSDKFDAEALQVLIDEALNANTDLKEVSIAALTPYFNSVFKDLYAILGQLLTECKLSVDELEELLIANFNREFLLIRSDARRTMIEQVERNNKLFTTIDYADITVRNALNNTMVNARGGLENSLDTLSMNLSYLRYHNRVEFNDELDEKLAMRTLFKFDVVSKRATVLKNTYDGMIWEGFYAKSNSHTDEVLITPIDRELFTIIEINKFRIDQLKNAGMRTTLALTYKSKQARNYLESICRYKRKPRHVVSITIKDGYIFPILRKGFSSSHLAIDIALQSGIILYYKFSAQIILPNVKTLTISDVSIMYAEICELATIIENYEYKKEDKLTIDTFYEYPFRIRKKQLAGFLRNKTTYTDIQITAFIELMTHKQGERTNFWSYPFIQRGDDLLLPLLPLTSSHILYIIDEWLSAGGYSLDERGPLFEAYVKQELSDSMNAKGYTCIIHPLSDLYIGQRKSKEGRKKEQVDLIAEFAHCILVAEIKCTGYPIESREWHNAYKRVEEGAEQLNRKVAFLETNKQHFAKQVPGLLTKPIVKTVITNYPLFSGIIIHSVTTCDVNYLTHYINDAGIDKGIVVDSREGRDRSRTTRVTYYHNEKEFCENLPKHLENSVFMDSMREMVKWQKDQLLSGPLVVENVKVDPAAFHAKIGSSSASDQ